jgi:hypothetical protein
LGKTLEDVIPFALLFLSIVPLAVKPQCNGSNPGPTKKGEKNSMTIAISWSILRQIDPGCADACQVTKRQDYADTSSTYSCSGAVICSLVEISLDGTSTT